VAREYYAFVARQACLRCSARPVEVAHIRLIISPKTGLLMPRSHKTLARFGCVPLCADCHRHAPDSIHNVGEESFNESLGRGRHFLFRKAASLMAEFMEGDRS